jgi:nucleotide-binding universal stress UspA family protein
VDFSPRSLEALDVAVSFARQSDASIVLLHVMSAIYARGSLDSPKLHSLRTDALRESRQQLAQIAEERVRPHVPVTHEVRKGVAYSVIVEVATRTGADLIVMASEGRTGLGRFLIGSVAEKVIRHARCSVLVVRRPSR